MSIFILYKISTSILQFLWDFNVTFYSFYQGSRRILQLLKWRCHTSIFTHVEPFTCICVGGSICICKPAFASV